MRGGDLLYLCKSEATNISIYERSTTIGAGSWVSVAWGVRHFPPVHWFSRTIGKPEFGIDHLIVLAAVEVPGQAVQDQGHLAGRALRVHFSD